MASSPALKVVFGNEIRRFSLTESSYACLVRTVSATFQTAPNAISLSYIDEEGDQVRITSDDELNFALKHLQNKLRIVLTQNQAKPVEAAALPVVNQPAERQDRQRRFRHERTRHPKDHHFKGEKTFKFDASRVVGEFFVVEGKVEKQEKKLFTQPGVKFSKVFTIKNESSNPWPADTKVSIVKGDPEALNAPSSIAISRAVLPNEEFNVVICGVAPKEPGKYCCNFRLASASGDFFGRRLKFCVHVECQEKPTDGSDVMLDQLKAMGFSNEPLNKRLMKQKRGDMDKVLDMLATIEANKAKKMNANKN